MECVLINAVSKPTSRTLHGRDYLVAAATLIVPGVLNGSQGPLFYPSEEINKDPWAWNGMPILAYHPTVNGQHVSGRDPDILAESGLGHVYRTKADETLNAELWFDVQAVKSFDTKLKSDHKILPRLEAGKPIEISTGLFTENHPAPAGAIHNGKEYTHIARNYKPDHLAVLPDQKGACSNDDGCGINVNADSSIVTMVKKLYDKFFTKNADTDNSTVVNPQEVLDMATREQTIAFLTANCDCWKGKEKLLSNKESFTDEDLTKLKANTERMQTLVANAAKMPMKDGCTEPDDDEEEETMNKKKPAANAQAVTVNQQDIETALAKSMGFQSVPHMKETFSVMKDAERQMRTQLVQKIVGNIADDTARQEKAKWLMARDPKDLQAIAELMPVQNNEPAMPVFNYFGAGGGMPTTNSYSDGSDDVLPVFNIDWAAEAAASSK